MSSQTLQRMDSQCETVQASVSHSCARTSVSSRINEGLHGEEKLTVAYFNRTPLAAFFVFTLVVIVGLMWSDVISTFIAQYIFDTTQDGMTFVQWLIPAIVITTFMFIVLWATGIPITAAYTL